MKVFDFSKYDIKDRKVLAKYFSITVVVAIVMCYSISFMLKSNNYAANKAYSDILDGNYIYGGVYIGEVYVGGFTKEQAYDVADKNYAEYRLNKYSMDFKTDYGYSKNFTYKALGASYDTNKAVDEGYEVNRSGSFDTRSTKLSELRQSNEFMRVDYNIDESKFKDVIEGVVTDADKEYSFKGKKASYDRTYDTAFRYLQIQEDNVEVYIPEE